YGHRLAEPIAALRRANANLVDARSLVADVMSSVVTERDNLEAAEQAVADLEVALATSLDEHATRSEIVSRARREVAVREKTLAALEARRGEHLTSVAQWRVMLVDERRAFETANTRRAEVEAERRELEDELAIVVRSLQSWRDRTRETETRRADSRRRLAE